MKHQIKQIIDHLKLDPHPEGGYFRETYRSEGVIHPQSDESHYPVGRHFSTAIYYLLEGTDTSSFHRIRSDETWHFYSGSSATIHIIHPNSLYKTLYLGPEMENGQAFQHTVPGGSWFGVSVDETESYILTGCTVAPGFDFNDFEMGDPYKLKQAFPEHAGIIEQLN